VTRAINNSCLELAQYLYSIAEVNQKAIDLVLPITEMKDVQSNSSGIITFPSAYDHLFNLEFLTDNKAVKCQRVALNQLGIIQKIPQRRPNLQKERILYFFTKDGIHTLPVGEHNFRAYFQKEPAQASIVYTNQIIGNEPRQTLSSKVDIPFNMNAFNILLYMVMEKLGFSGRDLLATEYARLGIQKEAVKTNN
jgi:hypothetical protein